MNFNCQTVDEHDGNSRSILHLNKFGLALLNFSMMFMQQSVNAIAERLFCRQSISGFCSTDYRSSAVVVFGDVVRDALVCKLAC